MGRREAVRRGLVRARTKSERKLARRGREERRKRRRGAVVTIQAVTRSKSGKRRRRGKRSSYIQTPTGQLVEIPESSVADYQADVKRVRGLEERYVTGTLGIGELTKEVGKARARELMQERLRSKQRQLKRITTPTPTQPTRSQQRAVKDYTGDLTPSEKRLHEAIKKFEKRDKKLKNKLKKAYGKFGLGVKEGDTLVKKALKGGGQTLLGLAYTGQNIGNILDKLQITGRALLTSSRVRSQVKKELKKTAKTTPKVLKQAYDPRKPENWANIALTLYAIKGVQQGIQMRGKQKVQVPTSKKGGLVKDIVIGRNQKGKITIGLKTKVVIRKTRAKIPSRLSGKNKIFDPRQKLPKGYEAVGHTKSGLIKAQKRIKAHTRKLDTRPTPFRVRGKIRTQVSDKKGKIKVVSPKTVTKDYIIDPYLSKFLTKKDITFIVRKAKKLLKGKQPKGTIKEAGVVSIDKVFKVKKPQVLKKFLKGQKGELRLGAKPILKQPRILLPTKLKTPILSKIPDHLPYISAVALSGLAIKTKEKSKIKARIKSKIKSRSALKISPRAIEIEVTKPKEAVKPKIKQIIKVKTRQVARTQQMQQQKLKAISIKQITLKVRKPVGFGGFKKKKKTYKIKKKAGFKGKKKKQKVKYTYTMVRAKKKRTDLRYFVGTELR